MSVAGSSRKVGAFCAGDVMNKSFVASIERAGDDHEFAGHEFAGHEPAGADLSAFWMPFTNDRAYKAQPRMVVSADGMHFRDGGGGAMRRVMGDTK